ncbi:DUF3024 domain-containing protein [Kribbella qitaiheensis]|uniref:DUF3024 domain-containing protein n=1 Tax=Kribbella qitaiheensis TaxID=1544730 RepID=UPI001FE9699A
MWSLYWRDRHLEFHVYDRTQPTKAVQTPAYLPCRGQRPDLLGIARIAQNPLPQAYATPWSTSPARRCAQR